MLSELRRTDFRVPNLREMLYIMPSTLCNLRCRFCAQRFSAIVRSVMPHELFARIVDEACAYGFADFGLTPMVGEPLTDPDLGGKLRLLEDHPGVRSYSLCTNFTLADEAFLARLRGLRKLAWLSISVYGHDATSFQRVTGGDERLFHSLAENLRRLAGWEGAVTHAEIRVRTTGDFELRTSDAELARLLRSLAAAGVRVRVPTDRYSNWGGVIDQGDLDDLGIRLKPQPERGRLPCAMLFFKHTVLPDGRLNACSDNDAHASMVIGDLTRQSFAQIYSRGNASYLGLIEAHLRGEHNAPCRSCSSFRSPVAGHYSHAFLRKPFVDMEGFYDQLA